MSECPQAQKPAMPSGVPAPSAGESPATPGTCLFPSRGPVTAKNDRWQVPGVCVFLVVIVWLVFGQTLGYEFVNSDDNLYVYENPAVTQGLSLKGVEWAFTHVVVYNWHPLTMMSHMLDCGLYGMHAGGHHLTNVLLHTTSVLLLFFGLRNMTGALWRSAFVAAVFAIHPLRVESVAWISERKDVLSGFFFMLTLLLYTGYVEKSKVQSPKSKVFYGLTLICFALGLMSKPMLVTLPFVLLLLDYWPLERFAKFADGPKWFFVPQQLLVEKIPLLVLTVAVCVITLLTQRGVMPTVEQLPFSARAGNALMSYTVYLWQMFYPAKLAPLYPYPKSSVPVRESLLAFVFLAAVSVGVFARRRKHPGLMVGWFWYLGMLVPVIGLVQVCELAHADRYTYLPQIGLYVMVTWWVADSGAGWRYRRRIWGGLMAVVIAVLTVCSRRQTTCWRDSESLWTHMLACAPESSVADSYLGDALAARGKLAEAIAHYERALQLRPDYVYARVHLANALVRQGKPAEAIAHYERALQLKPDFAEAHNNLGVALANQGKLTEAIARYAQAIQLNPDFTQAHINLGDALARQGKSAEAIKPYQRALQLDPDNAEVHKNLGNALLQNGQADEAIAQYRSAVEIKPDYAEARYNLAVALGLEGKLDEAIEQYRKTVEIKPDYADAHGNLARMLAAQGKLDEAVQEYQRTLALAPDSAQAHFRYGQTLQAQHHFAAAKAEYQKALELESKHLPARLSLAWLLATCPDQSLRDGAGAVELMKQVRTLAGNELPQFLDTLAAAYAETGRFDRAVETAKQALNLPATQDDKPLAEAIQSRLKLYEAHLPYRETP